MRLINNPAKSGTAIRETEKRITFIIILPCSYIYGADVCRKMKPLFYCATQNRINRSTIRALFLAESTHTSARKRNIGKEQM